MKSWLFPTVLLAVIFAATRWPALQVQYHDSDINLYARYAAERQAAERGGESFYDLHRRRVEHEMASADPKKAAALAEYRTVEYPPLAIALMTLPARFLQAPFDQELPTGIQPQYASAFVWMMVGFDAALFALVICMIRRLFPTESPLQHFERGLVYILCTWPLYGVLLTRFDVAVALLVTGALALLISRLPWCFSFAALALAINLKFMPIALVPLWVLASLPTAAFTQGWRLLLGKLTIRAACLAGCCLAIFAPFYLRFGWAVLEFWGYHAERGIEIESTWASLALVGQFFGNSWGVEHSHGSFNLDVPPWLPALIAPVFGGLLAGTSGLFVIAVWPRRQGEWQLGSGTIAQTWPHLVVGFSLLVLLISIVANKVFSPQYLLWVLPLVPLVDFHPIPRRLFYLASTAMCLLTMRIFPDCFFGEIVRVVGHGNAESFGGPTTYGAFLLLTRNALCVGLTVALGAALLREGGRRSGLKPRGWRAQFWPSGSQGTASPDYSP